MAKSVGRSPKLTTEEIKSIIRMYRENEKPMGLISYMDIHKYANQLFEEGVISAKTSDNYWRKPGRAGRIEVDKANEINSEVVEVSRGMSLTIPNMLDLVEKKYKDKDELVKQLLQVEKMFHDALVREKKRDQEALKTKAEVEELKDKLRAEREKNEQLQGLVFRLYRIASEQPTEEMKKQTEHALKTAFSNPLDFLHQDEKARVVEADNVFELKTRKAKRSVSDTFKEW